MVTAPHTDPHELARQVLRRATAELLESYSGAETTPLDRQEVIASPERELAVAVSFWGPLLHGTLALATSRRLLGALSPLRESSDSVEHGDWIAELLNQLLGRVKNKLVRYGIVFGSASDVPPEDRELKPFAAEDLIEERMRCVGGVVRIWLYVRFADGLVVTGSEEHAADEGSVQLF